MSPEQFRKARLKLGLSVNQMAALLEVQPLQVRRMELQPHLVTHRAIMPSTAKLVRSWLDGYRPKDWPA
jgi:hypothetical protein